VGLNIQNLLDFEVIVNQRTGEYCYERKKSSHLKNLIFTITPGDRFVKVQGSLHMFANNSKKNNNRLTYEMLQTAIQDLNPFIASDDLINVLEFGINIFTPFDPTVFIKNLIAHKKKQFNKTLIHGESISQVRYTQFIFKIYDKGLQQGPKGRFILRVEVKCLKMQKLFPNGLKWSDLADIKTWLYLGDEIKKRFSEIIYFDPSINLNQVPEKDRIVLERGHNPIYWENLPGSHVSRERKHYQNLIRKYGSICNTIPELVNKEINELAKSYHFSDKIIEESIIAVNMEMAKNYPLLYGNFSPDTINAQFSNLNSIDIQKVINRLIRNYYDCFFSDYSILSDLTLKRMKDDIYVECGLDISTEDLMDNIKQFYPAGLSAPF